MKDSNRFKPCLAGKTLAAFLPAIFLVNGLTGVAYGDTDPGGVPKAHVSGHAIVHESEISRPQSAPHKGPGETTAHPFFEDVSDLGLVFRKRKMHPGSAIGYHLHDKDEIYYVISGQGELMMNGEKSSVGPGTAILTRPGDSHGLRQVGEEDLVLFIVYGRKTD